MCHMFATHQSKTNPSQFEFIIFFKAILTPKMSKNKNIHFAKIINNFKLT